MNLNELAVYVRLLPVGLQVLITLFFLALYAADKLPFLFLIVRQGNSTKMPDRISPARPYQVLSGERGGLSPFGPYPFYP